MREGEPLGENGEVKAWRLECVCGVREELVPSGDRA